MNWSKMAAGNDVCLPLRIFWSPQNNTYFLNFTQGDLYEILKICSIFSWKLEHIWNSWRRSKKGINLVSSKRQRNSNGKMAIPRSRFVFLLICNLFVRKSVAVSRNFANQGITDLTTLELSSNTTNLVLNNNPAVTIPEGVFRNLTLLIHLQMQRIWLDDSDVNRDSFLGLISLQRVSNTRIGEVLKFPSVDNLWDWDLPNFSLSVVSELE